MRAILAPLYSVSNFPGCAPGHAFIQNLRRGHYELGVEACPGMTVAAAFDELALVI